MIRVLVSGILLVFLAPFCVFCAGIIFVIDRQHPFFFQTRIGKNHAPFSVVKFRTMKDEKATFLGRILRKTGIDEIPQLWNIFWGDMAFIGPRPLTHKDIVRLEWNTPEHGIRWSVLPGMTGLAQFAPICDAQLSWDLDMRYIKHKTWRMDIKIILGSCATLFLGKKKIKQYIV